MTDPAEETGATGGKATGESRVGAVLRLQVVDGNALGFSIAVEDRLVIGRQSEGPGRLAGDPELSRHHAEILREPGGEYRIVDLASTNGTFVNDKRIDGSVVLARADKIEVGSTTLEVLETPTAVDVHGRTIAAGLSEELRATIDEPNRTPALEIRITVDVERAEATIVLSPDGETVRMRHAGGAWQVDARGSPFGDDGVGTEDRSQPGEGSLQSGGES